MAITKLIIDRLKRHIGGRIVQPLCDGRTSTFDLDMFFTDYQEINPNIFVCYPPLGQILWELLLHGTSNAEYKDRKAERIIGGQSYLAIKIFMPEIHFLTIAGSDFLKYEYYLVEAPEQNGEIFLDNPTQVLHHIGVTN